MHSRMAPADQADEMMDEVSPEQAVGYAMLEALDTAFEEGLAADEIASVTITITLANGESKELKIAPPVEDAPSDAPAGSEAAA